MRRAANNTTRMVRLTAAVADLLAAVALHRGESIAVAGEILFLPLLEREKAAMTPGEFLSLTKRLAKRRRDTNGRSAK